MELTGQKHCERFGKIGVLMGGPSSERDISLKSGNAVLKSLQAQGVNAAALDVKSDNIAATTELIKSSQIDCAFVVLHGYFGEDGQIQRILDCLRIPYTGSGAMASKAAMDKIVSHEIFQVNGLRLPNFRAVNKGYYTTSEGVSAGFGFPLVVKPASHGSSIGLSIIDNPQDADAAIKAAFKYDDNILIEEYIEGREFTVAVLGDNPLPVIEIKPKNRFFDFEAKYRPGMTEYIVPAQLQEELLTLLQDTALKAHRLLGCYGCSRVDLMLDKNNTVFVLELNTIPGFTETSLLPKAAGVAGISFDQLCITLIELAYEKASKGTANIR